MTSATPKPKTAPPAGSAPGMGLSVGSVAMPLRFMVTGMLALVTGVLFVFLRPEILSVYHYNPHIVAVTHLFTLGWVTSIIMGALYQLAPVALETRLYSDRLARWQYVLHLVGVAGMVWTLWRWDMKQAGHFGTLVGAGMLLFVYNIARTLARVPRWNMIAGAISAALFWLIFTMFAGLYLAASKFWNIGHFAPFAQMHTHAHLGGIGFFVMLIVGVSYKLVPMFLLSEIRNPRRALWSIILLNVGLAGLLVTLLLNSRWKLAFAYLTIAALVAYGMEMTAIWRARKRRNSDWGLRYFFTALWLMLPLAILGIVLSQPGLPTKPLIGQTENLYGFLALIGLVTFSILGMLYKIVPFLVWYASYSKHVGRARVPAMHELYSVRLQVAGYFLFLGGLLATGIAVLSGQPEFVRWTWLCVVLSLSVFIVNMAKILSHLRSPKVEPIKLPSTPLKNPAAGTLLKPPMPAPSSAL